MPRPLNAPLVLAMIVAACGSPAVGPSTAPSVTPPGAGQPRASATPQPSRASIPTRLTGRLPLADGRVLNARCVGEGAPTILLEVGGSGDMSDWPAPFVEALGAISTTCLYSRAGGRGSSPPTHPPVSMDAVTADAYELLDIARTEAGVAGPYVFVGWSLGGSVALADALARPDTTVGIAILDTDFPADGLALCKASGRPPADCKREYEEDIDARFMEMQIAHAVHPLDLPARLVTAMAYPECVESPSATLSAEISGVTIVAGDCTALASAIADKQIEDWQTALPEITQTRLDANHDELVWTDIPAIAAVVREVVEAARAGS